MSPCSKLFAALMIFSMLAVSGVGTTRSASSSASSGASWTIMVYMADDYYVPLSWQDDINEMEAAQQAPGTNIIALVDPLGPNNSTLLKVTHDPNFLDSTIVSPRIDDAGAVITGGEVNMASPTTLSAFVNFSVRTYPADHYVLDLWGHGAGWRGLCPDGTDILTLPELGKALDQATSEAGKKIDMLTVDACAEANVETLWEIWDYVDYFVASEKDVPSQGLPYVPVLNDLAASPTQGVERFGSRIVDDYVGWSVTNSEYSATMGLFNLTRGYCMYAPTGFIDFYDSIFHHTLRAALDSAEWYENASTVDYGDFLRLILNSDIPLSMRFVVLGQLQSLDRVVSHFAMHSNPYATDGISVKNATGLTIYVPSNGSYDDPYNDLRMSTTGWGHSGRLLNENTVTIPNGPAPDINYHDSPSDIDSLPDSVTISMPASYGSPAASVFLNETLGLVEDSGHAIAGSDIVVANIAGRLTLDISTSNGPPDFEATSYHMVNVTLYGESSFSIGISREGLQVTKNEYDVTLAGPNGTINADFSGGVYHTNLTVPTDAMIGDLVTIEVRDKNNGEVVEKQKAFVPYGSANLQVDVYGSTTGVGDLAVPLVFSLLPGLLILAFAIMIRSQRRTTK